MDERFYSFDEVKEKYPYKLPFFDASLICRNRETFDRYNTYDDNNKVAINESNTIFINKQLVIDMLENKYMWNYFYSLCDKEVNYACDIIYIDNNGESHIRLTKSEFAYAVRQLMPNVNASDKIQYVLASYLLSMDFCYDYYTKRSKRHSCYIEGKLKTIAVKRLLNILTCSDDKFDEIISKKKQYGMKIEELMYLLVDFVEKNNLFTTYYFEPKYIERYNKIKSYEYVDYQSLNKLVPLHNIMNIDSNKGKYKAFISSLLGTKDIVFGKHMAGDKKTGEYSVNPRLVKRIVDDIDPSYDATEAAIYIYIRLCDLLSYDETDALLNDGLVKENLDYDRISKINAYDNKVVSSEFVLIYSKFLKDMGLLYQPHIDCTAGYANNYSYLTFKQGEFLVKVDLFNKSIIKNDLSNVKIGRTIDGIRCLNTNKVSKDKFREKVIKVYADYRRKYKKHLILEDIVKKNINFDDLSLETRIMSMYEYFIDSKLTGIELVNYIQTLINSTLINGELVDYMIYKDKFGEYSLVICCPEDNYMINLNDPSRMCIINDDDLKELMSDEYSEVGYYEEPEGRGRK